LFDISRNEAVKGLPSASVAVQSPTNVFRPSRLALFPACPARTENVAASKIAVITAGSLFGYFSGVLPPFPHCLPNRDRCLVIKIAAGALCATTNGFDALNPIYFGSVDARRF